MKKTILLTNFMIKEYTGSEIDTVTIANYFKIKGYKVSIFTINFDYPLKNELSDEIDVYTLKNIDDMPNNFDLIWSHHYPLLDYLLFIKKIKSKKIIYVTLSSFEILESLPLYYKDLTLVGYIDGRIKDVLIENDYMDDNFYLFPNYAFNKYFGSKIKNTQKISNICVVSNHVPKEIVEAVKLLKKSGINVDIYGKEYKFVPVDDNLLKKYDAVISIGKTIYYGLALGIPCYVYDHFGGYGFITNKNIKRAFYHNFSGKGFGENKSPETICNEILNYKYNSNELKELRKFANKEFNFEKNIEKILKKIEEIPEIDYERLYDNNTYHIYAKNSKFLIEQVDKNKRLETELKSVYNSTSWKLTLPIRKTKIVISKAIRKIRRKK